jgi:hypothetical protein
MTLLVDDLLGAVRSQIDESNTSDISDSKILATLQRAQMKLVRLATRRYAAMFKAEQLLAVESGTRDVTIPEAAFGLVVNQVEVIRGGQSFPCEPATATQVAPLDNDNATTDLPLYYVQHGSVLKLYPRPNGSVSLRVRYQRRPPDLVVKQGRVISFDATAVTADLDSVGAALTTSIASLGAFVNWVDATTGIVKATLQVSAINTTTNTVTFKVAGLGRVTVFGQTVGIALPDDAALDDYLCLASGTCVPMLVADYADYLIQFAVVELKRKQGEDVSAELAALKDLESDVTAMWAGRAAGKRVRRTSGYWGSKLPLSARYS